MDQWTYGALPSLLQHRGTAFAPTTVTWQRRRLRMEGWRYLRPDNPLDKIRELGLGECLSNDRRDFLGNQGDDLLHG